ncbi:MAG: RanGTP-binding protein-domain-containing protein [Piptocephalis tieghemiana]|nr:MAG: RanGTP-binding protein-domain-containing protein [Piptocephalis tieghemiana]
MDDLLSKVALTTASFVGKAAFGAASKVAMDRLQRYMREQRTVTATEVGTRGATTTATTTAMMTSREGEPGESLEELQLRFDTALRSVIPAVDLIETVAARGHTTLTPILELTTRLRGDMAAFSRILEPTARGGQGEKEGRGPESVHRELKRLLQRVESAVPFLNLALTVSGASAATSLPHSISPGRLLQASSAINEARRGWREEGGEEQVGPVFDVRLYSLFMASARKSAQDFTWREEMARARLTVHLGKDEEEEEEEEGEEEEGKKSPEYRFTLRVEENFDDERYHDVEGGEVPGRRTIKLRSLERMYFSDSGKLLHIEGSYASVLVLKVRETGDGREEEGEGEKEEEEREKSGAEVEVESKVRRKGMASWYAIELYPDKMTREMLEESDEEEEEEEKEEEEEEEEEEEKEEEKEGEGERAEIKVESLGLLEMILRLGALEESEGREHPEIPDERINLFLRDDRPSRRGDGGGGGTRGGIADSEIAPGRERMGGGRRGIKGGSKGHRGKGSRSRSTSRASTPLRVERIE